MENIVVPINLLAVFVAAVVSMVIGFFWYGPLFGTMWMKEMGVTKEKVKKAMKKGNMGMSYGVMFLGSLPMAYVLAYSIVFALAYMNIVGLSAGLMSGFWNWLGFVAPVTLGSVLWEGKSVQLWVLNNGYYFVTLLAMGSILSLWPHA